MKHYLPLLIAMTSFCLVAPLVANDQFNQGMQQGNASKGQGASAIQGFKPAEVILAIPTRQLKAAITGASRRPVWI